MVVQRASHDPAVRRRIAEVALTHRTRIFTGAVRGRAPYTNCTTSAIAGLEAVGISSGGSLLRFAAFGLRWAWLGLLGLPIVREGWIPYRPLAVGLLAFCLLVSGVTIADLLGFGSVHPGWFLGLEWWQRPIYPWIDLLPFGYVGYRPSYLWIISVWNVVEAAVVSGLIWRAGRGAREGGGG